MAKMSKSKIYGYLTRIFKYGAYALIGLGFVAGAVVTIMSGLTTGIIVMCGSIFCGCGALLASSISKVYADGYAAEEAELRNRPINYETEHELHIELEPEKNIEEIKFNEQVYNNELTDDNNKTL